MSRHSISMPHIIDESAAFAVLELSIHANTPHTQHSEVLRDLYTEMLFAGCGPYTREAFLDKLATIGSSLSISDSGNTISVQLRARREALAETLALLVCAFEKPHFKAKELRRIQKRYREELKLAKQDAAARAGQNFVNTLVDSTDPRYSHDLDVLEKEVSKVSLAEIRAFHMHAVLGKTAYGAVGGTQKDHALIEKSLSRIVKVSSDPLIVPTRTVLQKASRTVILVDIPHKQNIEFSIGGPSPLVYTDAEFAPLYFGMCVLSMHGGFAGRLMSTVRKKEGLTYNIYGSLASTGAFTQGFWKIDTFFTPKDAMQGITSTLREITQIAENGITEDELERFKHMLKTRFSIIKDSLIKRTKEQHRRLMLGLTEAEFEALKEDIAGLTRARVNAALKRYLDPSRIVISGAGPIRTVKEQLQKLAQ